MECALSILDIMCILSQFFLEDLVQLHAVRSDELLLQGGSLERNSDMVGIG